MATQIDDLSQGQFGRRVRAALVLVVSSLIALGLGGAAPEPSPVPKRWQLDIRVGPMRMMTLDLPDAGPRRFLYLTYRVTNHTGQDLLFAPAFDLASEKGQILRSGRDVPPAATREILSRLESPYLEDQISILGLLLQGDENARDGVVIWPVDDLELGEFVVYAAGFSGEFHTLSLTDPRTGEEREIVLRKTLMMRYEYPGEVHDRGADALDQMSKRWIMR